MKLFRSAMRLLVLSMCLLFLPLKAQHVNEVHQQHHENLMADQVNIFKELSLLDSLRNQLLLSKQPLYEPAVNLYNSWNDYTVDPYTASKIHVPDSILLDVSQYHHPISGRITSKYGWRRNRMHKGVDIKVYTGDTIRSAFDGKIRIRRYDRRGYGYFLVVRHTNGLETVYGHLSKFLVLPNQEVKAGDPIGLGGNTGRSTGSHLHFEMRFLGVAINPAEIVDLENEIALNDGFMFRTERAKLIAQGKMGPEGIAYHRVRSGDSLSRIASKYRVSVAQLCRLNNIGTRTVLRIGQRIRYS